MTPGVQWGRVGASVVAPTALGIAVPVHRRRIAVLATFLCWVLAGPAVLAPVAAASPTAPEVGPAAFGPSGAVVPVAAPAEPGAIVFGRSHRGDPSLWTLVPGGDPVAVPGTTGARSGRWSPDGRVIAFTRPGDGIHLVHPDGSGLRRIVAQRPGELFGEPIWSSDGRRLAFQVLAPGEADYRVEIAASLGGTREGLAVRLATVWDWLPDGTFLGTAWADDPATGSRSEELAVGGELGEVRFLTRTPGVAETAPRLSPDGRRIVFVESVVDPAGVRHRVATIARDGTDRRVIADLGSTATWPAWSPDGARVVLGATPTAVDPDATRVDTFGLDAAGLDAVATVPAGTVAVGQRLTSAGGVDGGFDWGPLPDSVLEPIDVRLPGIRALARPDTTVAASLTRSAATVWPVADGFRDTVTVTQRLGEPAEGTLAVIDAAGRVVRRVAFPLRTGSNVLRWNGRASDGSVLGAGRYTVVGWARDLSGNLRRSEVTVALVAGRP